MLLWSCLCTASQWRVTKEWLAIFPTSQMDWFEWFCGANICIIFIMAKFYASFSSIASMFKSVKSQKKQTHLVIPKAQRQKMLRLRVKRIERERTDKPNLCGEDGQVFLGQYTIEIARLGS